MSEAWALAKLGEKFRVDDMTVRRYLLMEGVLMRSPHNVKRLPHP
jgi:hypothetical protein